MKDRLSALLTVKSLVTVTLTGVFAALALQRKHPVALKVAAPCGALILAGPMAGIETNFHAALLLSCCVPK